MYLFFLNHRMLVFLTWLSDGNIWLMVWWCQVDGHPTVMATMQIVYHQLLTEPTLMQNNQMLKFVKKINFKYDLQDVSKTQYSLSCMSERDYRTPQIGGHTTQWLRQKRNKNTNNGLQNTTNKTKCWAIRTPQKRAEPGCSRKDK